MVLQVLIPKVLGVAELQQGENEKSGREKFTARVREAQKGHGGGRTGERSGRFSGDRDTGRILQAKFILNYSAKQL
jgi:hypothetical protein